jgi:hypothetical protein
MLNSKGTFFYPEVGEICICHFTSYFNTMKGEQCSLPIEAAALRLTPTVWAHHLVSQTDFQCILYSRGQVGIFWLVEKALILFVPFVHIKNMLPLSNNRKLVAH